MKSRADQSEMTCRECRERMGELLEPGAPAQLAAHARDCECCSGELAVLRGARNTLHTFPSLAPPPGFAAAIHARIEASPQMSQLAKTAARDAKKSRTPDGFTRTQRRSSSTRIHDFWERFTGFFNRPANVAWGSAVALSVFAIVILAQPDRRARLVSAPANDADTAQRYDSDSAQSKSAEAKAPATVGAAAATAKRQAQKPSPTAAPTPAAAPKELPSKKPTPLWGLPIPSWPFGSSDNEIVPGLDKSPEPTPQNSGTPKPAEQKADNKKQTPDTARPRPSVAPQKNFDSQVATTNSAPGGADKDLKRERGSNGAAITEPAASTREVAPEPERGLPAPAGALGATAADSAKNSEPSVQRKAARSMSKAKIEAAELHAQSDEEGGLTVGQRIAIGRIVPPRDLAWAQVSITLPSDARFSGSTKSGGSRIVWRGFATKGEAIEIHVPVIAGAGKARLRLQEVVNGQATTVATGSARLQ